MGQMRSPPTLVSTQSSTPYEAMAASQQAHIDELVQKNRTSEHTIKMLQQKLKEENERAQDLVSRLRAASQQERAEWREGCDSLLASHRIVHLRTRMELERIKSDMLSEREERRKDKLALLQRDYKLTLFQAKETELEHRLVEMQDDLEEKTALYAEELDLALESNTHVVTKLKGQLNEAEIAKKNLSESLESLQLEYDALKTELGVVREAHNVLTASTSTASTKLERAILQADGARSKVAELERANDELKRSISDLQRQLNQWENLEQKGGAEMEEMRKKRVELEVIVNELEERVEELTKEGKENAKALEKERKKVAKLDARILNMEELAEEAQNLAAKSQIETAEKAEELEAANEKIRQLKAKLEKSTNGPKESKSEAETTDSHASSSDTEPVQTANSEHEVEVVVTPAPPLRTRTKPLKLVENVREDEDDDVTPKVSKKRKQSSQHEESELETETKPKRPRRAKKARKLDERETSDEREVGTLPTVSEEDGGSEEDKTKSEKERATSETSETPKFQSHVTSSKGKGKAAKHHVEEDESSASEAYKDTRTRKPVEKSKPAKVRNKPQARMKKAKEPDADAGVLGAANEDSNPTEIQKKKKRKIFASAQPLTFSWDSLPHGDGTLNIPTELSPVKETDVVPQRSIFGSFSRAGSAFGWR